MSKQKKIKPQQNAKSGQADETQQDIVKEFYKKILIMQEEEKRRISRDLHDETGQILIALGASLNVLEKELKAGNIEKALTMISDNRKLIQDISDRMKSMAFNIRPPALDILGLSAALREYFWQCTKSEPLKVEFNENIKDIKLNENIEITVYRIIQEAVNNIIKHSNAKWVKVELILIDNRLRLSIIDDGEGFSVERYEKQYDASKLGLRGIKERVDILNGDFSIESVPAKGTRLIIELPMEASA